MYYIEEQTLPMFRKPDGKSSVSGTKEIEDCLECRLVGIASLGGVSGYAYHLRLKTPMGDFKQRLFLAIFSATFGAAAVARAIL